ncbi:MAG: YjbQ family protein [Candidatus Iainarchaeum archaeon]|uniref:YjbQ family protein n=1 Tax=Candidatus Iainarchaeum sp. TaxID=3101447 RepID=A0A497JHP2_9ARCH|nr:MAG: YjbQ family protein [Candidatus Diapherotrites archaeon]
MASELKSFSIKTEKDISIKDITPQVEKAVKESKIKSGVAVIFVPGSTASISTMEYEPGLLKDIPKVLQKIAPLNYDWEHHKTWHDNNGASHILANLLGPSLVVPFENKTLLLGTWQQIVLMDFDRVARERRVLVQIIG